MARPVGTLESASRHPLSRLHDPRTVRARCAAILRSVDGNVSTHFTIDRSALAAVADRVASLTRERFPDLRIPLHSRWRHFEAGGVDRRAALDQRLAARSTTEAARARFDLTVVSVLLDAGAGSEWRYREELEDQPHATTGVAQPGTEGAPAPARVFSRSEGLGVASWHAFLDGGFSASPTDPLRADAAALAKVDAARLRAWFQVSATNPMVGLEGRAGLLVRLGSALGAEAARCSLPARPSLIFDRLTAGGTRSRVSAIELLAELLRVLGPIWTQGSRVQGLPGGDVWPHRWAGDVAGLSLAAEGFDPAAASVALGSAAGRRTEGGIGRDPTTGGWVPFHKLAQWLAYSLVEPLEWAGVSVTGIDALTGLPEYRNGGLLLDGGVIVPRRAASLARTWQVGDEFVVEWRALTVALIDELAVLVRQRLGMSAEELPLARILEGGTWAAGRQIAQELRADGSPPLKIDSDGTLF